MGFVGLGQGYRMGDLGLGWGGLVDWGSGLVGWGGVVAVPSLGLWWVDSGSLIGDVSDEASLVVGVVGSWVSLDWGGVVGLVVGLTLVLDISNVTLGSSGVADDLDTAVRKVHTVGSVNLAIGVLQFVIQRYV